MSMTNYQKGVRLEREAKKVLEAGRYYVIRSAGSHGLFDLVAVNEYHTRLIQVRKGRSLSSAERKAIKSIPVAKEVVKELWTASPEPFSTFDIEEL